MDQSNISNTPLSNGGITPTGSLTAAQPTNSDDNGQVMMPAPQYPINLTPISPNQEFETASRDSSTINNPQMPINSLGLNNLEPVAINNPPQQSIKPLNNALSTDANQVSSFESSSNTQSSLSSDSLIADDVDLIEKEWVNQVEKISHSYESDPFNLCDQISKLKLTYVQKRYNFVITQKN